MKIGCLLRGIGIFLSCLLIYGIYLLATQWQTRQVGPFTIRQNQLTGMVLVKNGDHWETFGVDPYADAIPASALARVGVQDLTWDRHGLLCGRMVNENGVAVSGRLAVRIVLRKVRGGTLIKDRSLRGSVNLPAAGTLPFVLQTGLETPDPKQTNTLIELQPINLGSS